MVVSLRAGASGGRAVSPPAERAVWRGVTSGLGVAGDPAAEAGAAPGGRCLAAAGDRGCDRPDQPGVDGDAFGGGEALDLRLERFGQAQGDAGQVAAVRRRWRAGRWRRSRWSRPARRRWWRREPGRTRWYRLPARGVDRLGELGHREIRVPAAQADLDARGTELAGDLRGRVGQRL